MLHFHAVSSCKSTVGLARGDRAQTGRILFEGTGGIPDKENLFPRDCLTGIEHLSHKINVGT